MAHWLQLPKFSLVSCPTGYFFHFQAFRPWMRAEQSLKSWTCKAEGDQRPVCQRPLLLPSSLLSCHLSEALCKAILEGASQLSAGLWQCPHYLFPISDGGGWDRPPLAGFKFLVWDQTQNKCSAHSASHISWHRFLLSQLSQVQQQLPLFLRAWLVGRGGFMETHPSKTLCPVEYS